MEEAEGGWDDGVVFLIDDRYRGFLVIGESADLAPVAVFFFALEGLLQRKSVFSLGVRPVVKVVLTRADDLLVDSVAPW